MQEAFSSILKIKDTESSEGPSKWFREKGGGVFNTGPGTLGFGLLANGLGTWTIWQVGFPFKLGIFGVFAFIAIQPGFFFFGQTVYTVALFWFRCHQLVRLEKNVEFLNGGHRAAAALNSFTFWLTLFAAIEYLGLLLAVVLGPFESSGTVMVPWLMALAVAPFLCFIFGTYQVHTLLTDIKISNLEAIETEIQSLFKKFKSNPTPKDTEQLAKAVEIKEHVEGTRVWPMSPASIMALVAVASAVIVQALATISQLSQNPSASNNSLWANVLRWFTQ